MNPKKHLLSVLMAFSGLFCSAQDDFYEIDFRSHQEIPLQNKFSFQDSNPAGISLGVNNQYWTQNNTPWIPIMGEFHYTRYPSIYWEEEIRKMKSAGIKIISTYVFWETHENPRGVWNWTENCDLRRFVQLCKRNDLFVWLRIGPYCNAEMRHGGLPSWISTMKGRRSNNPEYLSQTKRFYQEVSRQVSGSFFNQGGPIIGIQVENEFANGQADHLDTLKQAALDYGMTPVYFSVTANSVFHDTRFGFLPLQGAYPYRGWEKGGGGATQDFLYGNDQWILNSAFGGRLYYDPGKYPRGLCEQGCGSQMEFLNRFTVDPSVIEAHLQNQIGRGMNLIGYYMFQGGTQTPDQKRRGYPESYDFQAPISEFGILRPSYRYLKILHHFLNDFGEEIAPMQVVHPSNMVKRPTNTDSLRYIARMRNNSGFIFVNNTQVRVPLPAKKIKMKLLLTDETIEFPRKPFVLNNGTTAIIPFNYHINGSLIKYATAQPLARINQEGIEYLFLMQVPGIDTEIALDASSVKEFKSKGWETQTTNGVLYFTPKEGKELTLTSSIGAKCVLVLLSRHEAENSWRLSIDGQKSLIISDSDLTWNDQTIQINNLDSNIFTLKIFPHPSKNLFSEGHSVKFSRQSLFSVAKIKQTKQTIKLPTQVIAPDQVEITLPQTLPKGVNDLFLSIDYLGSSAEISSQDRLLNDHLFHEQSWMVGLKRYLNKKDQPNTILLKALPWNDQINGIAPETANRIKKVGPKILNIDIHPQYTLQLNWK